MKEIQVKIEKIKSVLRQVYPDLVCDISIKDKTLSGYVLSEKQKKFILNELILLGVDIKENIKVLTSFKVSPLYGWGVSKLEILDVIKSPTDNWDKLSPRGQGKLRETQVLGKGLPFRLIYKKNGWYLSQLLDLSIGWVYEKNIVGSKPGKKPKPTQFNKEKFISIIESYISTPYLWGGTTREGIDCSGLTQRIFLESMNLLLPKHSQNQKIFGTKIDIKNIEVGDLVFAKSINKSISHVAAYVGDNQVVHACLRLKIVSIESLRDFKKYYRIDDIVDIKTMN